MRRRRTRTLCSQETAQRRRSERYGSGSLIKNRRRQHQGGTEDTDFGPHTCYQTWRKPCQISKKHTRNLPRTPICGRTTTNTNIYMSRKLTSFRQSDPSRRVRRAVRMSCAHNASWSLRRAKKLHRVGFINYCLH